MATGLALVLGCAPHVVRVPELAPAARADRYRTRLAEREARADGVDARILLWAEVPAGRRLPGTEGRLLLEAPDAFRLRVASAFGTALDVGGRGESLSAYVPSRRQGVSLDAARDSLGVARPGGLVVRTLTAGWHPPEGAWQAATWQDTLMRVAWVDGRDTLVVDVGSHGLPARVTLARSDGEGLLVEYRRWERSGGVAWPAHFELSDRHGGFRLACRVARLRFPGRGDPQRLAVPMPAGVEPMSLPELRRVLGRMGAL